MFIGKKQYKTMRFSFLNSTMDYAKTLSGEEDVFVVAGCQRQGRGRDGRTFSSQKGGLYLTFRHCPKQMPAKESFWLVSRAAVAVCKTLEGYGLQPVIKWPNDVLVGGKKICGILTENTVKGNQIACAYIGIGLNVRNALEEELLPIATSIFLETGKKISVKKVLLALQKNLLSPFEREEYYARLGCLGDVEIVEKDKRYSAFAIGVDEEGLLVVTVDGRKEKKSAAEISLRPKR